jgi:cytochrome c
MRSFILAFTFAVVSLSTGANAAGEAAAGKKVFNKCAICHSASPGDNGVGPTLSGVVGRQSASVPGYSYSEAMKAANKIWDEATLTAYLKDPKGAVPGTKMAFPGLPKDEERGNLIAYLATLK